MARHSKRSEDETDIFAVEVPLCRDTGGILGGPYLQCQLPAEHSGVHKAGLITWDRAPEPSWPPRGPMFRGMDSTDEQPLVAERDPEEPPPPATGTHSLVLVVGAVALLVGVVLGALTAMVLHEPAPASHPTVPVTITKTVPPPTTSETP